MPSERKKMQKVKKSDVGGRAFSYAQFIYRVSILDQCHL